MWKSININKQNIKAETEKAVLITCPHNSDYDGWEFWHPAKLVREGRHDNAVSVSYTEDFNFILKKYGKGKWNKNKILDEQQIDFEEFEEMFEVMNENIKSPDYKSDFETHKPKQLEAGEVEVLEELKDE